MGNKKCRLGLNKSSCTYWPEFKGTCPNECPNRAIVKLHPVIKATVQKENANLTYAELGEVPTNVQVFKWLKSQKYQTDMGDQEYRMYFDVDMPKILEDYFRWRKEHFD
ncbi:MAG: hypothetical protein GY853_06575 [PVC group bacterium]|nr:hypothetical protein [PVC group bacterium]